LELERQENILVVCHQAVLRCLYAYLYVLQLSPISLVSTRLIEDIRGTYSHNLPQEDLPYIKIPLYVPFLSFPLPPTHNLTNESIE